MELDRQLPAHEVADDDHGTDSDRQHCARPRERHETRRQADQVLRSVDVGIGDDLLDDDCHGTFRFGRSSGLS
jgi:hypothetical protein